MPISKYNEDGTVDIYNKKTGEVRTGIKPETLGSISPSLVAEYQQGQSPESVLSRKQAEVNLQKLNTNQTDAQKETVSSVKSLSSDIALLEQNRQRVSPLLRGYGQKVKSLFSSLDKGDVDAFNGLQNEIAYSMAKTLANQTGQGLSDKDVISFKNALPNLGDTEKGAKNKLTNLAQQMKTRLVESGQSEQDAHNFVNNMLSEVGLGQDTTAINVANKAYEIPSFSQMSGSNLSDIGAEAVDTATNTEKKSLQGIGENALNDVQSMIEGTTKLPSLISQMISETNKNGFSPVGVGGPVSLIDITKSPTAQTLVPEIIKSTIEEYKNLITHPIEQSYNHPVNTILDVIPVIAGLKKLKAAALSETGSEVTDVARLATQTDNTSDVAKIAEKAVGGAESTTTASRVGGIIPTRAEIAAKTFSSAFIVPTKRAKNLKPVETAAKMLDYGVSGSLDDMANTASKITGDTGVLTKVTRNAIGNLKGEVDIGNAATSAKNMLRDVVDLSPDEENRIINNIIRAEKTGKELLKSNPMDAYDTAKRLEALGHQQLNSSTYLTKNVKAEGIGKAYLAASDEIMSSLEKMAGEQNIVNTFKTPEIMSQLESVSPKLASEFQNTKTLSDVRSLQAPFVRLNQMIDLTEQAANTAFQSAGRNVGSGIGRSVVGGIAGSPFGPLGTIAGAVAGQVIGPPVESIIEAARPSILTKTAKFINR